MLINDPTITTEELASLYNIYTRSHKWMQDLKEGLDLINKAVNILTEEDVPTTTLDVPRLLTLNELEDKLDEVVWIDFKGKINSSNDYVLIAGYSPKLKELTVHYIDELPDISKFLSYADYNITWRAWNLRPSEEQRIAVKWSIEDEQA